MSLFEQQARVLWDLRFGQVLGLSTFEQYLRGTDAMQGIMEIPVWPQDSPDYLNRNVLVDGRIPEQVGLKEFCRLCGIAFGGDDNTLVPYDPSVAKSGLHWMRGHDGRRNCNVAPSKCRTDRFVQGEVGQDAVEGISLYVQDRTVLNGHVMDLPGSVHAGDRGYCACLEHWGSLPELHWFGDDYPSPYYGSASRRSV